LPGPDPAREQADKAAAEAAAIGGHTSSEPPAAGKAPDEAQRPLVEGGEGEAEGFELAEEELVEHASHGDQHAARQALEDAPDESGDISAAEGGEADHERSSERREDLPDRQRRLPRRRRGE
jgi:hypothetical protein